MAFVDSGVDINGLQNIEPPVFNVSSTFLVDIPVKANELTGGYLGMIISVPMFAFLFAYLSDVTEFGGFRYTSIRAIGIAACMVTIMGFMMLAVGFFNNYYHIVIFATITAIATLWVYIEEQ
jgi:hypothetical protein